MKRLLLVPLVLLHVSAFAADKSQTTKSGGAEEGRALIDENCLDCHDDSYITSLNLGREQWGEVLELMIGMGMSPLEPEIQEKVLDYLEEEHGPRVNMGLARAVPTSEALVSPESQDLPWAFPRYPPNPLYWRER